MVIAVQSLYMDRLKPVSRVLRKRLFEHLMAKYGLEHGSAVHIDMAQLHAICATCPALVVQAEGKGDWSALLLDRPADFVDIYGADDVYPVSIWEELQAFCEGPAGDRLSLPGGRCSCAQALRQYGPTSLRNRSLGEVCHIIELALAQKKILGYSNGNVVAYRYSQQKLKEEYAGLNRGMPCNGISGQDPKSSCSVQIADLATARMYLERILEESDKPVPLPNIKRLFLSRFKLQLTETAFGHSKISDLLQDERFSDICTLEWKGNGFSVSKKPARVINLFQSVTGFADSSPTANTPQNRSMRQAQFCVNEPLELQDLDCKPFRRGSQTSTNCSESPLLQFPPDYSEIVRGPFIHARLPPPTPWRGCRRSARLATVPKDMGRDYIGSLEDTYDSEEPSFDTIRVSSNSQMSTLLTEPCTEDDFTSDITLERLTSSMMALAADGSMTPITPGEQRQERSTPRMVFCPGDELPMDIGESAVEVPNSPAWISCTPFSAGLRVQNTFFNVPPELPTPVKKSASTRSRSLPKTFGVSSRKTPKVFDHAPLKAKLNTRTAQKYPTLLSPSPSFHLTPTMSKFPETPW
jgi:hypothetical protein